LEEVLKELKESAKKFEERFGLRVSFSRTLSILMNYPCILRCLAELELKPQSQLVDTYYLERHEFVRKLLLDALRLQLLEEGFRIQLNSENHADCSTGDIDLKHDHISTTLSINGLRIRVEVKGGIGFSITQILRHLLDANAVVLCLAGRGEAITITKSEAKPLIEYVLKIIKGKLKRLIEGDTTRIPGPWCHGCSIKCEHAKPQRNRKPSLSSEFVKTIQNWDKAIEQTVQQVIDLLRKMKEPKELELKSVGVA